MALKPTINLRQKPHLAATQKMRQSLEILSMSNFQLDAFLKAEQDDNPLLEMIAPEPPLPHRGGAGSVGNIVEETLAVSESMISAVVRQIAHSKAPALDRKMALLLSENLNSRGYLDQSLEEISAASGNPAKHLHWGLLLLQSLEPTGVGARNTAECIELQLRAKSLWDEDLAFVLHNMNNHGANFSAVALKRGISKDRLSDILDTIRCQTFDPSEAFNAHQIIHVIPDVLFSISPDGTSETTLNENAFPRLRADSAYLDGSLVNSGDVESYLKRQTGRIDWLSRTLEKRSATILKIAVTLGEMQKGYFDNGPKGMIPLTMKTVADRLGIAESTVSRAVAGKHVLCSEGTVPMRYFFPSRVDGGAGKTHSATMIRSHIRDVIDGEDLSNIVTDTNIANLMAARGITVARRTIAKYRDGMNIPKSSIRRVQKRSRMRS